MSTDWTASMGVNFEFCEVDPTTWMDKQKLTSILSCSINRDVSNETIANASFESVESLGEIYIRVYFTPTQNGLKERYPLGTFLVQTPGKSFNGMYTSYSLDAYSPLIELKYDKPPLCYTVKKGVNIMDTAAALFEDHARAPLVPAKDDTILEEDFTAETSETWLSFLSSLIAKADYSFDLDETGTVLMRKDQEIEALQPRYTYTDDDISILYPDIQIDKDLYNVPNKVEVIYSTETAYKYAVVTNEDENSPISIPNRGMVVLQREENPDFGGTPTDDEIENYANRLLKSSSTLTCTLTYSHMYTPVRVYDGVRLNYERLGDGAIKAMVTTQKITCDTELKVDETAIFTQRLWGEDI